MEAVVPDLTPYPIYFDCGWYQICDFNKFVCCPKTTKIVDGPRPINESTCAVLLCYYARSVRQEVVFLVDVFFYPSKGEDYESEIST